MRKKVNYTGILNKKEFEKEGMFRSMMKYFRYFFVHRKRIEVKDLGKRKEGISYIQWRKTMAKSVVVSFYASFQSLIDHRERGGYASFISLRSNYLGRDAAMHSKSGLPSLEGRWYRVIVLWRPWILLLWLTIGNNQLSSGGQLFSLRVICNRFQRFRRCIGYILPLVRSFFGVSRLFPSPFCALQSCFQITYPSKRIARKFLNHPVSFSIIL